MVEAYAKSVSSSPAPDLRVKHPVCFPSVLFAAEDRSRLHARGGMLRIARGLGDWPGHLSTLLAAAWFRMHRVEGKAVEGWGGCRRGKAPVWWQAENNAV